MVRVFLHVCEQINLPAAHDKTEYASSQMVFLGILLDGYHLILALPLDKKIRAINMLKLIIDKKKATLEELQRLTGYLNFLSKAIFPGHTFTRRMYTKFSGLSNLKKFHHIRLDQEFKLDCRVWLQFLTDSHYSSVCRPMIDVHSPLTSSVELDFYSDASTSKSLGFGGVFGCHWMFGKWLHDYINNFEPSIAYLELFALTACVLAWKSELKNIQMILFCNNQSMVHMVNHTSSHCKNCMVLIRMLVLDDLFITEEFMLNMSLQKLIVEQTRLADCSWINFTIFHCRCRHGANRYTSEPVATNEIMAKLIVFPTAFRYQDHILQEIEIVIIRCILHINCSHGKTGGQAEG